MASQVFTAPHPIPERMFRVPSIFLLGSIEGDKAERWQDKLIKDLSDLTITIANPRRPDYRADEPAIASNPYFAEQVKWEQEYLAKASILGVYFAPGTNSIISMGELFGALERNTPRHSRYATYPSKEHRQSIIVYCPDAYKRCGNVELQCAKFDVPVHKSYDKWAQVLRNTVYDQLL